jgi:hypothetical protein
MSDEKNEPSEPTLTQFIENNHNLISTMAIFATLSAFANNLPDKDMGKILSFSLFALALLVGIEIIGNFRLAHREKLHWFQEIFTLSMLIFGIVWVQTYYPYLLGLLFMTLAALVVLLVLALCRYSIRLTVSKIPWLKTKSQRTREEWIPTIGAMLVMTLGFVALRHFKLI